MLCFEYWTCNKQVSQKLINGKAWESITTFSIKETFYLKNDQCQKEKLNTCAVYITLFSVMSGLQVELTSSMYFKKEPSWPLSKLLALHKTSKTIFSQVYPWGEQNGQIFFFKKSERKRQSYSVVLYYNSSSLPLFGVKYSKNMLVRHEALLHIPDF